MRTELKLDDGSRVTVEMIEDPLPWQMLGLQETVTGYGSKMTTPYKVKFRNRWRRVYVAQFGNAGTAYIGKPGQWEATVNLF